MGSYFYWMDIFFIFKAEFGGHECSNIAQVHIYGLDGWTRRRTVAGVSKPQILSCPSRKSKSVSGVKFESARLWLKGLTNFSKSDYAKISCLNWTVTFFRMVFARLQLRRKLSYENLLGARQRKLMNRQAVWLFLLRIIWAAVFWGGVWLLFRVWLCF